MLILILMIILLALAWGLYTNEMTFQQRNKIIDIVFNLDGWRLYSQELYTVSYHDHYWKRFFLLDPIKLYSNEIQEKYNEK